MSEAPGAERLSMPTPTSTPSVAALYVQARGVYYGVDGVDAWGLPDRDAREYAGPWPVVAPPETAPLPRPRRARRPKAARVTPPEGEEVPDAG